MSAKETLVATLTNCLAVTRVGRMDAHRKEAERLVDEVLHEEAKRIKAGCRALPEGSDWFSGMFDAANLIDPYEGG